MRLPEGLRMGGRFSSGAADWLPEIVGQLFDLRLFNC
jgi:hypothetical protein